MPSYFLIFCPINIRPVGRNIDSLLRYDHQSSDIQLVVAMSHSRRFAHCDTMDGFMLDLMEIERLVGKVKGKPQKASGRIQFVMT